MSTVKENPNSKAWAPPEFPVSGRFPTQISAVTDNYDKQTSEKNLFRQGVDKPASYIASQYLPQRLNTIVEDTQIKLPVTTVGTGPISSAICQEELRLLIVAIKDMLVVDIFSCPPGLSPGSLK
jgi:hypothetical protein